MIWGCHVLVPIRKDKQLIGNNEPRLVFVKSWDTQQGFRSGEGVDNEIVVRELVQNALDAGACKIAFSVLNIPLSEVPDIDGYRRAVQAIHPELKKTPVAKSALERINRVLEADQVTCLLCTDNGSGLGLDEYRRLLAEAMSAKVDDAGVGKLGSVGVGHLTAFDASDLRYVLYNSHGPQGELFGGQTLLASQQWDRNGSKELRVRRGCLTASDQVDGFVGYEAMPADPEHTPEWLQVPPSGGTTVAILGYGLLDDEVDYQVDDSNLVSDPLRDKIFDVVARHFMVALKQGNLQVTYSSEISSNVVVLDETEITCRLQENKNKKRASTGRREYGSGARAWQAWETLTKGEKLPCDGGTLWYQLTPGETPAVVVFRNGMRITHEAPKLRGHDFKGVNAFSAVFNAESDFGDAIRECETDSHLEIKLKQAPDSARKRAQEGLQAVQEALKNAAGAVETEEWVPDVLRIFDAENMPSKVETAPRRRRPARLDSEQQPLPEPSSESGSAPPGPEPGSGPENDSDKPSARSVKPQTWRPGSVEDVRKSFVPLNDREAFVEWDFIGDGRKPATVGVAITVGSGSQPADRRPEPDHALSIRVLGGDDEAWAKELKVPASEGMIRVEVRNAPVGWEAVSAVVSRRA